MKQKAIYYLFTLLFGIATLSVQAQSLSLNIIRWSGDGKSVNVGTIDKITFTEDDLVVNYVEENSESIDILSIRKMTFSGIPANNINVVGIEGKISVSLISSNQLIINNLPEGNHEVSIYSVSGSLIRKATVHSGSPIINIGFTNRGVYVIMVNNQALKFVKS